MRITSQETRQCHHEGGLAEGQGKGEAEGTVALKNRFGPKSNVKCRIIGTSAGRLNRQRQQPTTTVAGSRTAATIVNTNNSNSSNTKNLYKVIQSREATSPLVINGAP